MGFVVSQNIYTISGAAVKHHIYMICSHLKYLHKCQSFNILMCSMGPWSTSNFTMLIECEAFQGIYFPKIFENYLM